MLQSQLAEGAERRVDCLVGGRQVGEGAAMLAQRHRDRVVIQHLEQDAPVMRVIVN